MGTNKSSLGLINAAYERMVMKALEPGLLLRFTPTKSLTRKQKIKRFPKRTWHSFVQKIHDWTEGKGAYCESD